MRVWNVLHAAGWKCRTQKLRKNLRTIAQLCQAISSQLRHISTIGKKILINSNISCRCPYDMVNFGPLTAEIGWLVEQKYIYAPEQISTGFASWLRYCSDVAHWRPTIRCTMFGRLLGWYTIYACSGAPDPWRILPGANSLWMQVLRSPILAALKPNSITLASWDLAPNMFGASSELVRSWLRTS